MTKKKERSSADAKKVHEFVPEVVYIDNNGRGYGTFLMPLDTCRSCKKYMLDCSLDYTKQRGPLNITQQEQLKIAGWVKYNHIKLPSGRLCQECADESKLIGVCKLCNREIRQEDVEEDAYGGTLFCKQCYNSMSASDWDKATGRNR